MKPKTKTNFLTVSAQVDKFIMENSVNLHEPSRVVRNAYIEQYANQFDISFETAKEHFNKYKDFLFMNGN